MTASDTFPLYDYTPVAREYAEKFFDELRHKPFDRAILDRFAERVRGLGLVCDVGCGPGQVARYLQARGVDAFGLDLSPAMIEEARRLNPQIRFDQGDMRHLPAETNAWGGIAAFYTIIHIPRQGLQEVMSEFYRALKPSGLLLLAFHVGEEVIHLDEWWEKAVSLDFFFYGQDEINNTLGAAGFVVEQIIVRPPYPEVEHPSQRGYALARK